VFHAPIKPKEEAKMAQYDNTNKGAFFNEQDKKRGDRTAITAARSTSTAKNFG
jgi:hypothetical protein